MRHADEDAAGGRNTMTRAADPDAATPGPHHYIFEVRIPSPAPYWNAEETFHSGVLAADLDEAERIVRYRYPLALRVILLSVEGRVA